MQCRIDSLSDRADALIGKFEGRVSFYAKNLDTGAALGVGGETRVATASTIKTAIMVGAHGEVAAGRAAWDERLLLTDAKRADGSGVLLEMAEGLQPTLRDAVNLMIVVSDNIATNLVLERIGTDAVNAHLDALGLPEIRSLRGIGGGHEGRAYHAPENAGFGIGVATPRAMVALLEKIAQGEAVSPDDSAAMIAVLKRQQRHLGIGRRLEEAEIASKSGALDRLRSDMGIVYAPRGRIALSITCDQLPATQWSVDSPAYLMISTLTDLLIDGLTQPA